MRLVLLLPMFMLTIVLAVRYALPLSVGDEADDYEGLATHRLMTMEITGIMIMMRRTRSRECLTLAWDRFLMDSRLRRK